MPCLLTVLVGATCPQVDDGFPANLDAQRRTTLLGIIEQRSEGFTHRFELQLIVTLDLHPLVLRTTVLKKACIVSVVGGFANWLIAE
ncbi:hypothetical protein D3C71_1699940 [compost metagenome]